MMLPGGREYPVEYLTREGHAFEAYTNGHAVAYRAVERAGPTAEGLSEWRTWQLAGLLSEPVPADAVLSSAEDLAAMLGAPEYDRQDVCPKCLGLGRRAGSSPTCACACCECERCDGTGTVCEIPPIRDALICRLPVNANLVAACLDQVGASGACRVWVSADNLMIEGDGWRIVVVRTLNVSEDCACRLFCGPTDEALPMAGVSA